MSKVFKDFLSNLRESFLGELPVPSNTSEEKDFKIMENIEISKTVSMDQLPGRFLKNGAEILSKAISEIRNLSISLGIFPNACKATKLKSVFKKGKKID